MLGTIKKVIILVLILGGSYVAYSMFSEDPTTASLLKSEVATETDQDAAEIIKTINQINTLKLDRSVFDDPIFRTLVDRSEKLDLQPKGRVNPFAPIGPTVATTTTSSATTTNRVTR